MIYAFLFILCLFSSAVITFDEETLIIFASIIWADAAGGLFKKLLEAELVHKIDSVHAKFVWFLTLKRQFLLELVKLHSTRKLLSSSLVAFNVAFLSSLVLESISLYLFGVVSRHKFDSHLNVVLAGAFTYYDRLFANLEKTMILTSFSEVMVRPAPVGSSDLTLLGYSVLGDCFA